MVQYRRDFTPGATYFFTVSLKNRQLSYFTHYINELKNAFLNVYNQAPFITHAIVVLPEHIHAIWELPNGDYDYSRRWRLIKTHFTRSLLAAGVNLSKNTRNEYDLWQRRFWEHRIRDEYDLTAHIDYIHFNPVKHGYVKIPIEWLYSSVHRYIKEGILPMNWGENRVQLDDGILIRPKF